MSEHEFTSRDQSVKLQTKDFDYTSMAFCFFTKVQYCGLSKYLDMMLFV